MNTFYQQLEEKYRNSFEIPESDYHWLKSEVEELSKLDRKKEQVIRRKVLIQYLHDKLNMSFYQIGRLLHRHHTSITNLYRQV